MVEGRVLSIEEIQAVGEAVFDLEVEDNHNFFVNGVLVSNSQLHGTGDHVTLYQRINELARHIYFRLGLTGTHFRSKQSTEMLMRAMLSEVVGRVSVGELIQGGYLVPADVFFVPIEQPRLANCSFEDAYRFGVEHHETRNRWIVWAAQTLAQHGRRVVVLVKLVKHGEKLQKMMPEAVNINGEDSDAVDDGIMRFNAGKIPILIGTSVLGEGIDLPRADALVYAKGQAASVTVTQDIYRVLTATDGKTSGIVVDFADRHHPTLLKHSMARARLLAKQDDFNVDIMTPSVLDRFLTKIQAFAVSPPVR